jgi:hypothetical protein
VQDDKEDRASAETTGIAAKKRKGALRRRMGGEKASPSGRAGKVPKSVHQGGDMVDRTLDGKDESMAFGIYQEPAGVESVVFDGNYDELVRFCSLFMSLLALSLIFEQIGTNIVMLPSESKSGILRKDEADKCSSECTAR